MTEPNIYGYLATDLNKQLEENDLMLVPGRLSVELAEKLPMTFVMTAEFDFMLRDAIHVAKIFEQADRLAGWSCTAGGNHAWSIYSQSLDTKELYKEWRSAMEAYTQL